MMGNSDKKAVVEIVDKLLDTIEYEIKRMREMGEDTSVLEGQLRDFRRGQRNVIEWLMKNDEISLKLFLNQLSSFSKNVHNYYLQVKSGRHLKEAISKAGEEEIMKQEQEAKKELQDTYSLIADEDYLLKQEFGEGNQGETEMEKKSAVPEGVMQTKVEGVDDKEIVEEVESLLEDEKRKIELLKRKGEDVLDKEVTLNQQESLLISLKEAVLDGRYSEAERLKEKIFELGRLIE